jgi:hypothetical protein
MLQHNKKRNVGLLNEFFARHIANLLVSQKHDSIDKATKLYSKYFSGDTQIAKEWKLFQALYTTNVGSSDVAHGLVEKIRGFAKKSPGKYLEQEKTKLIHEINNTLGDKEFFSRSVGDYKIQATIQVLLNSWRSSSYLNETNNLTDLTHLEDNLVEHLTRQKVTPAGDATYLEMSNEEIDGLVVNLMSEKFNGKFSTELSPEQRAIISNYVFAGQGEAKDKLVQTLEGVRTRTLRLVENTLVTKRAGNENLEDPLVKKLVGIKNLLLSEYKDTSRLSDETVTFYMTLTKLEKELA